MRQWIASEQVAGDVLSSVLNGELPPDISLDEKTVEKLKHIRKLRNDILYGDHLPSEGDMLSAAEFLEELVDFLRQRANGTA